MVPLAEAICCARRRSKNIVHSVWLSTAYLGLFHCASASDEWMRVISSRRAAPSGTGGTGTPPALSFHKPGTRYMNVDGMLPFENLVADYVQETNNHVLYRVTPIFEGDNLVASGVLMEALSMEDGGEGVCFNVYVYNVQPGVTIDYATGESRAEGDEAPAEDTQTPAETTYILNTSSKKFHLPDCSGVDSMNPANRQTYVGSREALLDEGYSPCGQCNP